MRYISIELGGFDSSPLLSFEKIIIFYQIQSKGGFAIRAHSNWKTRIIFRTTFIISKNVFILLFCFYSHYGHGLQIRAIWILAVFLFVNSFYAASKS